MGDGGWGMGGGVEWLSGAGGREGKRGCVGINGSGGPLSRTFLEPS